MLQSAALKVTSEVDAESGDKTRGPVELVKSRGIGQRLEKLLMKTISDCYVPSFHPGATSEHPDKWAKCIQKTVNEHAGHKGKWSVIVSLLGSRIGYSIKGVATHALLDYGGMRIYVFRV